MLDLHPCGPHHRAMRADILQANREMPWPNSSYGDGSDVAWCKWLMNLETAFAAMEIGQ
jgi:hypothetical protein